MCGKKIASLEDRTLDGFDEVEGELDDNRLFLIHVYRSISVFVQFILRFVYSVDKSADGRYKKLKGTNIWAMQLRANRS